MNLTDKVVVVMGAGDVATGRSSALELAARGAHVIAVDPSADATAETCRQIEALGFSATGIVSSITDETEIQNVADQCAAAHGHIDGLVNCYLYADPSSVENADAQSWQNAFTVNVLGPVLSSKAFLPLLKASGNASIVHLGSVDGTLGNPMVPSYSATKGALTPLTHVMAEEFAQFGIRVNCVARAAVNDGRVSEGMAQALMPYTPLSRFADPAEVGRAVAFFVSDDSSYCTGTVLPVDGGRTAITPGTIPPRGAQAPAA